jgi:hypothetical protein
MRKNLIVQLLPAIYSIQHAPSLEFNANQGFFSGKRGAGTHKKGKDKHKESFATISLSCSPTS